MFLEKFFPASRTIAIRKEICGIRQHTGETLHEYWERFNMLCATCPHHQNSEQLLIQYFYEGLIMMDRSMIDAASGGALDNTPAATRNLISNMTSNTQQFGTRKVAASKVVNEVATVDNKILDNKITELTSLVRQLAIGQHYTSPPAKVCAICTSTEHPTDACPILQELNQIVLKQQYGGQQYGSQQYDGQQYDLVKQMAINNIDLMKQMATSNIQFQQNAIVTIQDLKTQIGQLDTTMNQLQSTSFGYLPFQTILNPKGNVSIITLRSGKELPQQQPKPVNNDFEVDLLAQQHAKAARKSELDEEFLQTFRKVEINIPLLETIKQILKNAKFLKELCTHKRKKLKGGVEMERNGSALIKSEQVSALSQLAMSKKCRDPYTFTVPCTIGDCTFIDAMLDLGASINVMPLSMYKSLNFDDLEPTSIFYVLNMEDEPSSKGSTSILGRPFFMTTRTKIDVHAGTLSMEFDDNMVQFNIFEAMKHRTKNHSIFGIDMMDILVDDYMQLDIGLSKFSDFSDIVDVFDFADLANFECMCDRGKGSSSDPLYDLDPEIEITLRRLRKVRNTIVSNSSSSSSVSNSDNSNSVTNDSDSFEYSSANISTEPEQMENNDQTLKELATPDVPVLFNTWGDIKHMFLEKFFLASRIATIRKEICGIRQHSRETLHEYWERFNKLCVTYPHHQINEQLLIQYFYEGLTMMDQSMTNAANGGALMDKMPTVARHLISNMASNTQQFRIRGVGQPQMVNEIGAVDNLRLENQLTELTSLVRQLAVGKHQPSIAARVCGICTSMEHPTDMYPTLKEIESDHPKSIGVIGGYQYGKQLYQSRQFDN
ncbi:hypothetical protein CR513_20890, partial [Mucuna pruriens]